MFIVVAIVEDTLQGVPDVAITIVVENEKAVFGYVTSAAMNSELLTVSNLRSMSSKWCTVE
jgi:hypothetical protein